MKLKDLVSIIDSFAPFSTQEDYDNSGIQFGDLESEVNKILIALDLTSEVVEEAIKNEINTIITHHPPIFLPQKRFVKSESPAFFKAITNMINIVSAHTNFDLATNGLNDYYCRIIGVKKIRPIVQSKEKTYKIAVYVPVLYEDKVRAALFNANAGRIGNYSETSFNTKGIGTFKPLPGSHPFLGTEGKKEEAQEIKIETIVLERDISNVLNAMKKSHPYEEPAYDLYETKVVKNDGIGAVGEIEEEITLNEFTKILKEKSQANYIRLIEANDSKVKKIALCTGSGGTLIKEIKHFSIDLFVTGDLNYHQALDLKESGINTIEIEHFDTEKFFAQAMFEKLREEIHPDKLVKSTHMKSPFKII